MKKGQSLSESFSKSSGISKKKLERALNPPNNGTFDILHGKKVKDPFRPLENLKSPKTLAWVKRESQKFDDFVAGAKAYQDEVVDFLDKARPQGLRETMPEKFGDKYIVERKTPEAKRFSYWIKDVPDYGAPARLLLDPEKIDPSGKTTIKFASVTADGKTAAYALNVSGSDKGELRFLDVASGKDLGYSIPDFQTNVNETVKWDKDGKGLYYNQSNPSDKSNAVRFHKLGTPVSADKTIYAPKGAETGGEYYNVSDAKGEPGAYEYVARYKAINVNETDKVALLVRPRGSDAEFKEIFPQEEGLVKPIAEVNGKTLMWTNYKSPNAKLVAVDINNPSPDKWQDVLPQDKNNPLKEVFVWQDKIFASYSNENGQSLKVFDLKGKHLHDVPVPPLSTFTLGQVRQDSKELLIAFSSFQEHGSIFSYNPDQNKLTLFRSSTMPVDLKDAVVELIEATSKDGTKVPATIVRPKNMVFDGTAQAISYGYGGFNIPLEPNFSPSVVKQVKDGGIYVQMHLRGGSERGQDWYDGGRLKNKQKVFEDAKAIAKWLYKNKYTSKKRNILTGGSNGGLLVLAVMVQAPKLFGAYIAHVPVADMNRFHKGSYEGFSWKSDYGDPDVKKDFKVASKYSPLHNVKHGLKHNPLLIKTDYNDDRVLPWHSYKMAATLQTREHKKSQTFLKVNTDGGHSGGQTERQRFEDIATDRAFASLVVGPVSQQAYPAWKAEQDRQKKAARTVKKVKAKSLKAPKPK